IARAFDIERANAGHLPRPTNAASGIGDVDSATKIKKRDAMDCGSRGVAVVFQGASVELKFGWITGGSAKRRGFGSQVVKVVDPESGILFDDDGPGEIGSG